MQSADGKNSWKYKSTLFITDNVPVKYTVEIFTGDSSTISFIFWLIWYKVGIISSKCGCSFASSITFAVYIVVPLQIS